MLLDVVKIIILIFSVESAQSILYLYDRSNNRAVKYDFADVGNIYYTSANLHSAEYAKPMLFNRSKSLPNLRSK